MGILANAPIRKDEKQAIAAVLHWQLALAHGYLCKILYYAVIRSLRTMSTQKLYSTSSRQSGSSGVPSHTQVPPDWLVMLAFTAIIYAIAKNLLTIQCQI